MGKIELIQGDCLEKMEDIPDESVDAIVSDPPYELGFMGKKWDASGIAYNVDLWKECLRVLKPGGHLLAFGGTRTYHRMAVAIEDAGFEVRDMLEWIYASGFPKSLNIGKAVDKLQGNGREVVGEYKKGSNGTDGIYGNFNLKADVTKGNSEWEGFGTALKPAHEPICMARKPLSEKTIVENVLKHGTGGIDIDGCRIPTRDTMKEQKAKGSNGGEAYGDYNLDAVYTPSEQGRFPANLVVSDDALENNSRYFNIDVWAEKHGLLQFPKASKRERNEGCEGLPAKDRKEEWGDKFGAVDRRLKTGAESTGTFKNHHPTLKPVHLMSWLVRLVSKEGDTVLDPFMGSGTTGIACKNLDRKFIGIELDPEYFEISEKRINENL